MKNIHRIIPTLRYRDAKKAINWLCETFDFEEHVAYYTESGEVAHAQLIYRGSMIMLGSTNNETEYSNLIKQPDEIGGFETQSPYIIVDEADMESHYQKSKDNGAGIVIELREEDYGGKSYSCKDLEGHLWNFGSYNPWT